MFQVVDVYGSAKISNEQLGTKPKYWVEIEGDPASVKWLYKADARRCGDDWAEKVVCEIAAYLGIPRVLYELALDKDRDVRGVMSPNMAPPGVELVHGDQLLLDADPNYPAGKFRVHQHTIEAVARAVEQLVLPPLPLADTLPDEAVTALDVFVGYLMLDALVGNQDRHDQNWGALEIGGYFHLAPTYDHGSSLARSLRDEDRSDRLSTKDTGRMIPHFARKARSKLYMRATDVRPLGTVEAWLALAGRVPQSASAWLRRIVLFDEEAVQSILSEVPQSRMTSVCRQFTLELVMENRRRLLAEGSKL